MNSNTIDRYYKDQPQYVGTHYLHEFDPNSLLPGQFAVLCVDIDVQDTILGHFVLLKRTNSRRRNYVFFNSFGVPAPEKIRLAGNVQESNIIYQNPTSSLCGYYCLYIADMLSRRQSLPTAVSALRAYPESNVQVLVRHFSG